MEIRLKTLTPLWTGGVDGTCDRLHETGIIGSLRWWYEAIVRGLGGYACDPTSDNPGDRCHFNTEAYQKALQEGQAPKEALQVSLQNACPVCRLLGCSGWKRRFKLTAEIAPHQLTRFWLATLDKKEKFNHWWLSQVFKTDNNRVYIGELPLQASFIRGYEIHETVLQALLSFMAKYGAIGSRTQYGFGQFVYPEAYSIERSLDILRSQVTTMAKPKSSSHFYSLQNFWHLQCQVPDINDMIQKFQQATYVGNLQAFQQYKSQCLPVSFDIRYKLPQSQNGGLRQTYRLAHGKEEARQVFGTVQSEDKKWGSRVFVSHLYKENDADDHYQLRVWGFTNSMIRQEIQSALEGIFQKNDFRITVTTSQTILKMAERAL
jgi:CRISPR-associated protein Cmr1